jgi:hypothetical protein
MDDAAKNRKVRKTERRKGERKRAFTAGLLVYGGGAFVLDCLIRDIGATGAQIRASTAQPMPNEGYLIDLKTWIGYQAHRVWYQSSLAGFAFEKEYQLSGALPANLEFLRSLFIEAQLRQVDHLTANGLYMHDALAKMGVTNATYFRWLDSSARPGARRLRAKAPAGDDAGVPNRL